MRASPSLPSRPPQHVSSVFYVGRRPSPTARAASGRGHGGKGKGEDGAEWHFVQVLRDARSRAFWSRRSRSLARRREAHLRPDLQETRVLQENYVHWARGEESGKGRHARAKAAEGRTPSELVGWGCGGGWGVRLGLRGFGMRFRPRTLQPRVP